MKPTEKKLLKEAAVADRVHRDRAASRQTFTPGEWTTQDCAEGIQVYGPEGLGEKVALVNGASEYRSWERVKANARLIAAAPDMLAALGKIARIAEGRDFAPFSNIEKEARAAIAKAEGLEVVS